MQNAMKRTYGWDFPMENPMENPMVGQQLVTFKAPLRFLMQKLPAPVPPSFSGNWPGRNGGEVYINLMGYIIVLYYIYSIIYNYI